MTEILGEQKMDGNLQILLSNMMVVGTTET